MVTAVISPATQGHCSQCHRIWTLETGQGLCQWCGKLALCQNQRTQALRTIKSRANGRRKQANGNNHGYNRLEGDWALYYKVASHFVHKVRSDDREDFLHDLMLEMAKVKAKYEVIGKPLTEAGLMRVASYQVTEYWERLRRLTTWLDCGNCSKEQRRKCREELLYAKCPKFHQLVSLNGEVDGDGDGEPGELIQFIADDKAVDLDAWLDAKRLRQSLPRRLVQIGYKRYAGTPLAICERKYLCKWRRTQQKILV